MRDYVKYAGILFAITLVTALLLGVVNTYTAPVIEKYKENKAKAAIEAVVKGKIDVSTEKVINIKTKSTVVKIVSYKNDGNEIVYAVKSVPSGYAGDIEMMIGFDYKGHVTGVEIVSMSETAGLGANAKGNTKWLAQFMGKGQEKLDSLTGATVTSEAIQLGIDDARARIAEIVGGAEDE